MLKGILIVLIKLLESVFYFLLGWLIIIPISYIIPKDDKLFIFKGTSTNVRYLFFHAYEQQKTAGTELYFMTRNKRLITQFRKYNLPLLSYPSLLGYWKMFQAGTYIVDNHISPLNYYIFYRSKKVQLWHGIVVKKIGPSSIKGIRELPPGWLKTLGMKIAFYPTYDYFVSNSDFCSEKIFGPTIKAHQFLDCGYPRNDVLFKLPDVAAPLLDTDEISNQQMRDFRNNGGQIVVFAPTWRDTGGDLISDKAIQLDKLNEFGIRHQILFVFKFHPTTKTDLTLHDYSHCIQYGKGKDIYPALSLTDAMITDYSSIYLDYLMLKKPLVFFPYDYEKYTKKDRDLIVDYEWFAPGLKCYTQAELEKEIEKILINKQDLYAAKRQEILDIACKYQDSNASARVWDFISDSTRSMPVSAAQQEVV